MSYARKTWCFYFGNSGMIFATLQKQEKSSYYSSVNYSSDKIWLAIINWLIFRTTGHAGFLSIIGRFCRAVLAARQYKTVSHVCNKKVNRTAYPGFSRSCSNGVSDTCFVTVFKHLWHGTLTFQVFNLLSYRLILHAFLVAENCYCQVGKLRKKVFYTYINFQIAEKILKIHRLLNFRYDFNKAIVMTK